MKIKLRFPSPPEVHHVEDVEHDKKHSHRDEPRQPQMLRGPEKWNTFEVAQKERGIADRRESTANVAHDENEKDHVESRDAEFVHADPRTDHEHGGPGRADEVRDHCPDREEDGVAQRGGFAAHADVHPTGHDKKRPDERDEADVFVGHIEQAVTFAQNEKVVSAGEEPQGHGNPVVVFFPPVQIDERHQRDAEQDHAERNDHKRIRLDRDGRD